jgi:hypothetical protein
VSGAGAPGCRKAGFFEEKWHQPRVFWTLVAIN